MKIEREPIGFVQTDAEKVPWHWTISDLEGKLVIDDKYTDGLKDIKASQRIVVIFYFHKRSGFTPQFLIQRPPNREERLGVFLTVFICFADYLLPKEVDHFTQQTI